MRMAVNDETGTCRGCWKRPRGGSRRGADGVIIFHSGEDRIVKQEFLDRKRRRCIHCDQEAGPPVERGDAAEPASRSAKLRGQAAGEFRGTGGAA